MALKKHTFLIMDSLLIKVVDEKSGCGIAGWALSEEA